MKNSWAGISDEKATPIFCFITRPENLDKTNKELAKRLDIAGFKAANLRTMQLQVRRVKFKFRWGMTVRLTIKKIRRDPSLQPRAAMDRTVVKEYAEKMREGRPFVPPTVFFDGTNYWLADGWHRVEAAILAGLKSLHVEVIQGMPRDAQLFAVGANAAHGLRRNNADKRRAVLTLLNDEEWSQRSDSWIAEKCFVAHSFVGKLREEIESRLDSESSQRTRTGSDGRVIDTSRIGGNPKSRRTSKPSPTTLEVALEQDAIEFEEACNRIYGNPEPSANGVHEPEAVEPETIVTVTETKSEKTPWPLSKDVYVVSRLIAQHFAPVALEALLRDLAGRIGFTLTPIERDS